MDICFVSNNIDIKNINIKKKEIKFICFDWWTFEDFKNSHLNVCPYDAYLTQEVGDKATIFVEKLLENWQINKNEDFSVFEEISAARSLSSNLRGDFFLIYRLLISVIKLIKIEKPSKIYCDEDLTEDQKKIIELVFKRPILWQKLKKYSKYPHTLYSDYFIPTSKSVKKSNLSIIKKFELTIFSIFNNLRSFFQFDKSKNILFSYYQSLDSVLDEIKQRNKIKIYFAKPSMKYLLFPAANPLSATKNKKTNFFFNKICKKWAELKKDSDWRKKFIYLDQDVSEIIIKSIDRFFYSHMEDVAVRIIFYKNYLLQNKLKLVVVPYDTPPDEKIIIQTARLLNIPSLLILHGYPHPSHPIETEICFNLATDHVVVWGNKLKQMYSNIANTKNIYSLGNPAFDKYYAPATIIKNKPKKILLLSSPRVYTSIFAPIFSTETYILKISEILKKYPEAEVTIKLHPSENLEYYKKLLGPYPNFNIVRDIPIKELLINSDAIICPFITTVIFESIALNKPTLIVNIPKINYKKHHAFLKNLGIIEEIKTLEKNLDKLFKENSQASLLNLKQRMEEITGPINGNSSKRIADLIEKLISGAANTELINSAKESDVG